MNIKQLLMGSLALAAIGGASSVGLYYQSLTMERKEKQLYYQALNLESQNKQSKVQDKKHKADEYYVEQLSSSHFLRMNSKNNNDTDRWVNDIKEKKQEMKQDGYFNSEIAMIEQSAFEKAL